MPKICYGVNLKLNKQCKEVHYSIILKVRHFVKPLKICIQGFKTLMMKCLLERLVDKNIQCRIPQPTPTIIYCCVTVI